MHISYKKINNTEYGYVIKTSRIEDEIKQEIIHYLGRVLDKEKLIFKNRKNGLFQYDECHDKFLVVPPDYDEPVIKRKNEKKNTGHFCIDFGEDYFVDKFSKSTGFINLVHSIKYKNIDTIHALFHYYVISNLANCYAENWWESSYARVLFPKAKLTSQRISETLAEIGDESVIEDFLQLYYQFIFNYFGKKYPECDEIKNKNLRSVLIDSTGVPNSSKMEITAVNNHNGVVSKEIRVIYVVHQKTGMPLYFRYVAGNIIDSTTLKKTKDELIEHGIDIGYTIFDAGYFNHKNADILYEENIAFLTRIHPSYKICKAAIKEYLGTLNNRENLCRYNGRYVFIQHCECKIGKNGDHLAHLYVCRDMVKECMEKEKLMSEMSSFEIPDPNDYESIEKAGIFFLISSEYINNNELLQLYYTREHVEDIFKISKGHSKLLPLYVETIPVFRGHLLMTFLASIFHKLLLDEIKKSPFSISSIFNTLKGHHAEIYPKMILIDEPRKKAREIYEKFNIEPPSKISLP